MKNKISWTIVVLALIIGGVALIQIRKSKESKLPAAKSYAMVVSGFVPKSSDVQLTLPYIALVQNDADITLSTKVAGRVDFIKPSGSKVSKGEIIVKIDDTGIRGNITIVGSQIEAAETILKNLKATHQRTLELLAVKGASIEQSQNEESQIANLEAQLEALKQKRYEANNMTGYAVIKAPVDGILAKIMLNLGEVAMPGQPVVNISTTNGNYLLVRVPGNLPVNAVLYEGQRYETVNLNSIFNGLNDYKVFVDKRDLISGSKEDVDVVVFSGNGIKLPHDVILNRNGKSFVLLVNGDKAKTQLVNILQTGEDGVIVDNKELVNKQLVVAKQDVLLRLSGGSLLKIKN